ncbi:MAG: Ig-like domain-containing protein [Candidatus Dormibacterales bacterium]
MSGPLGRTGAGDPDLDAIFEDPRLLELAGRLHAVTPPAVSPDPAFRSSLRRELMRQAWSMKEPTLPWWRRFTSPPGLAWTAATVGATLLAFVAFEFHNQPGDHTFVLVNSPLDRAQAVTVQEAIPLVFNQPMNHASVEAAVKVQPATRVTFQWSGDTLYVHPQVGQLAPNTQYRVKVLPTAQTSTGQAVAKTELISFVTAPVTVPGPSPSPSVTPATEPAGLRRLAQVAGARSTAWSPDAATVYVAGAEGVEALNLDGSAPVVLERAPADRLAVSPDGSQVLYSGPSGTALVGASGGAQPLLLSSTPSTAVGWQGQTPVFVSGARVLQVTPAAGASPGSPASYPPAPAPSQLAALPAPPTEASFSPDGERLAYAWSAGTAVLDLKSAASRAWPEAASDLAWTPSGGRLAFVSKDAVMAAQADGSGAASIATLGKGGKAQVTAGGGGVELAWSAQGVLAIATDQGLWRTSATGSGPTHVATVASRALSWAPDGSGIALASSGSLGVAPFADPSSTPSQAAGDGVVEGFMKARVAGQTGAAAAFLDPKAQAAYGAALGGPAGSRVERDFVLASERVSGGLRYLVRVLLAQGQVETAQFDEALTVVSGPSGKPLIDQVQDTAPGPVGDGASVVALQIYRSEIQLTFDSDLQASTVPGAVSLVGPDGNALASTVTYAGRVATLRVPAMVPGTAYQLVVASSISDIDGHQLPLQYTVSVTGPQALAAFADPGAKPGSEPQASPSPSPSPGPSPSPSPGQ